MPTSRLRLVGVLAPAALVCFFALATATTADAATSCTAQTPCLPQNSGFATSLPVQSGISVNGSFSGGFLFTLLNSSTDLSAGAIASQAHETAIEGTTTSDTHLGAGVWGVHNNSNGASPGVRGTTYSVADQAAGVLGEANAGSSGNFAAGVAAHNHATNALGAGLWASHDGGGDGVYSTSQSGMGVEGLHLQNTGTASGVHGWTPSTSDLASGVSGEATGANTLALGVYGSSTSGTGVLGSGGAIGLLGYSANGYAGYFLGNVAVTGTLTKGAGAFRIDHPLDPAHKYLQHSFVESPDMKDVYDGVVTTDGKGFATVRLPKWFQALNKDFRYQLTIVGRTFAQAIVWKEIAHNRFTIRTNQAQVKVSWQVTGIRHDPYANAHRIQTVVEKRAADQGRYLHPELYGKPSSRSIAPRAFGR